VAPAEHAGLSSPRHPAQIAGEAVEKRFGSSRAVDVRRRDWRRI